MTELDQQRLAEWIGDAFAILCVRTSGLSSAEKQLRLGFESMLRELGTPPLGLIAHRVPLPPTRRRASVTDLRHILRALDAALAVLDRYAATLTPAQRRVRDSVLNARCHAAEELADRMQSAVSTPSTPLAAPLSLGVIT